MLRPRSIWTIEVAKRNESIKVHGYDIDLSQAPPKQWLPSNVDLGEFDALAELPEHVKGRYDVVHVRLFLCVIRDNDPKSVIRNLMGMLKSGGYIQWEEYDLTSGRIKTATEDQSFQNFTEAVHFPRSISSGSGDTRISPRSV
jgi:hypothetical protein